MKNVYSFSLKLSCAYQHFANDSLKTNLQQMSCLVLLIRFLQKAEVSDTAYPSIAPMALCGCFAQTCPLSLPILSPRKIIYSLGRLFSIWSSRIFPFLFCLSQVVLGNFSKSTSQQWWCTSHKDYKGKANESVVWTLFSSRM